MTHTGGTVKKKGAVTTPPSEYFVVKFAAPDEEKTFLKGDLTDDQWALLQEAWDKDRGVEVEIDPTSGAVKNLAITK